MVYRIAGGIFLLLLAISAIGGDFLPGIVVGIIGIIAGIALLAGF